MARSLSLPQPWEDVGHTADLGIRVRGADAEETLARLVVVFGRILAGTDAAGPPGPEIPVAVAGDDPALAAVDVLRELLWRFDREGLVPVQARTLAFGPEAVEVAVASTPYDPGRHAEGAEVKAVTLHAARFEPEGVGWVAQVVFDI